MPKKSIPAKKNAKKTPPGAERSRVKVSLPRQTKAPRASRPLAPALYRFPATEKGLLDWNWARDRLTNSHNYVIVTVRPDGRPHAMGMHGLWIDDAFYFGTGVETRKAKNLAANPHCILINEQLDELIIIEGTAEAIGSTQLPAEASSACKKKYGWPMQPMAGGTIFRLVPRVAFAFPEKQITTAITRWIFE